MSIHVTALKVAMIEVIQIVTTEANTDNKFIYKCFNSLSDIQGIFRSDL